MSKPERIIRRISEAETNQQKFWLGFVSILRASKFMWLYFLVPAGFLAVSYVLFYIGEMDSQSFFSYGGNFYSTMGLLTALWIMRRISKKAGKPLVMGAPQFRADIEWKKDSLFFLFGMSTAWALSFVLTLAERAFPLFMAGYSEDSMRMYSGLDLGFTIFTTVLLAPIIEEIIFRGYMLDTLLETFEEGSSILICTLIFALCHGNLLWILYAGAMGWLFAWVSMQEEGVYHVILMHIGFNLPSAVIILLTNYCPGIDLVFENLFFMASFGGICVCVSVILAKKYKKSINRTVVGEA